MYIFPFQLGIAEECATARRVATAAMDASEYIYISLYTYRINSIYVYLSALLTVTYHGGT